MWQRFTERARRVVYFAQEEAGRLGENYVSTEHFLLGLVRENDSVAVFLLNRMGVALERVRSEIERQVAHGEGHPGQDMQLTPRAKRVIDLAYDEAQQFNNNYIGTEHLLLGLIREGEGLAGRVLNKLGVDLEHTRHEAMLLQDEQSPQDNDAKGGRDTGLLSPSGDEAVPKAGDLGTLVSVSDRDVVELAVDAAAFDERAAIYRAKDVHGYREMKEAGRFFTAAVGTPVKYLILPAGLPRRSIAVRVLEGEFAGRKGCIARGEFQRTGPDDAPFPPRDGD